jgi:dihydropteroate synthase
MGILNMTPDSFSGDGLQTADDPLTSAIKQARQFIEAGADIIDVGGESTRPGSDRINGTDELARVLPVIESLRAEYDIPISIDTYKAEVAEAALNAGADMINDVWAFRADPGIARVASQYSVPVILMHNRSNPGSLELSDRLGGRYSGVEYNDLIADIKAELMQSVDLAHQSGIPDRLIILDSGIGFGKTTAQNLELLDRSDEIRALGYPLLVGPSRKSFIGYTLDLPTEERIEGTAATVAVAIVRGADIVRVHDVKQMTRVARMTDAIVRR